MNSIYLFLLCIVLPLILLVLLHRQYTYKYCQNDMTCLKNKLVDNLNKLGDKLNYIEKYELADIGDLDDIDDNDPDDKIIEGFFGGLGNWFSGSNPTPLPVTPGSLGNQSLDSLEKKINKGTPLGPLGTKGSNGLLGKDIVNPMDDFKDSDNSEILAAVGSKPLLNNIGKSSVKPSDQNKDPVAVFNKPVGVSKSLLGSCNFYSDKCPDKYYPLGNFSIQGNDSMALTCGDNAKNSKPAKAIAEIKNNRVYDIHVIDGGSGYDSKNLPKVRIDGEVVAEVVVDKGIIVNIKVIKSGNSYTDTPQITIDPPNSNSSCHLCCPQ